MNRTPGHPADIAAHSWRGDVTGALSATASTLPFVLSYGFIVFGALGPSATQAGLMAAVIAVVIGGAVVQVLSRTRLPCASPSASVALVIGATVLDVSRDAAIAARPDGGLALLLAAIAAMVVGAGVLMVLLGLCGAGRLVRYVPRPVLAGFMDGVAILILVSQVPPLLGIPAQAWARDGARALTGWQWVAPLAALGTAGLMGLVSARAPRQPAALVALVGGGLAVGLWQWWAGPQASVAQLPGVGSVSSASFQASAFAAWRAGVDPAALAPHLRLLATTAAIVALIGSMESLLNIAAVEQRIGGRADPDRELVALGVATMVSGAAGGLPVVYMRLRVLAAWDAGARRPLSMALVSVLVALVFLFAAPFIARLPTAVVGGIVVMLAIGLFDRWTRLAVRQWRSGRRDEELTWSLAVAMLVCVVTVVWGFAAGVLSGTALAVWIFMRALDRRLVRSRFTAKEFPSRRLYTAQDELALAPHRPCIRVLELEGALFFGTADRLLDEGERLEPDTKTLIVDLRRVTMIDATGADALSQLSRRLADRGVRLRLSGLRPDDHHDAALRAHGLVLDGVNGPQAHPNVDLAIEAAEHEVLTEAVPGRAASIPLVQCHLFDGLDEHQARLLASHMTERRLEAGERLFAPGDPGDDLYVLTEGSINIVDGNRGHRYVSVSPGMCFGEVALLDRGGRTAGAVADAPSVVHALSAQAFAALLRDEPALAAQVYRNLAIHLSGRLRVAAAAWWHAAG